MPCLTRTTLYLVNIATGNTVLLWQRDGSALFSCTQHFIYRTAQTRTSYADGLNEGAFRKKKYTHYPFYSQGRLSIVSRGVNMTIFRDTHASNPIPSSIYILQAVCDGILVESMPSYCLHRIVLQNRLLSGPLSSVVQERLSSTTSSLACEEPLGLSIHSKRPFRTSSKRTSTDNHRTFPDLFHPTGL